MTYPIHRGDMGLAHARPVVASSTRHTVVRSTVMLLLQEELSRSRSRQLQREAAEYRLARQALRAQPARQPRVRSLRVPSLRGVVAERLARLAQSAVR